MLDEREIRRQFAERSNWGRWGHDDEVGAPNLITPEKRVAAARLVHAGRTVSLARPFPKLPAPANPQPAEHRVKTLNRPLRSGAAVDYYGIWFHGLTSTHIDALCHTWDETGLYNGRDPDEHIGPDGSSWASVANWKDGIVTRGVLLDIPRLRGEAYVTMDRPVMGDELAAAAETFGISFEPGDAVVVHSGREAWDADTRNPPYGSVEERPGLHASCIEFLRDVDCSVLVWDMMDLTPSGYDVPWAVHGIQIAYGVALLDNALIEPLADVCAELGRYEFMLTVAPLNVEGGTGSPVNPIALF